MNTNDSDGVNAKSTNSSGPQRNRSRSVIAANKLSRGATAKLQMEHPSLPPRSLIIKDPIMLETRNRFALKSFALVAVQLLGVLGISFALGGVIDWTIGDAGLLFVVGIGAYICLAVMLVINHFFKNLFPVNYLMWFCIMCVSGVFWGVLTAPEYFGMQVIIIFFIMSAFCCLSLAVVKMEDVALQLFASIGFGWLLGVAINVGVALVLLKCHIFAVIAAVLFSLTALMSFLMDSMITICKDDTDNYMKAVAAMNVDLLVALSFIVIVACVFMGANPAIEGGGDADGGMNGIDGGAGLERAAAGEADEADEEKRNSKV